MVALFELIVLSLIALLIIEEPLPLGRQPARVTPG
jgi:hypothetical protein